MSRPGEPRPAPQAARPPSSPSVQLPHAESDAVWMSRALELAAEGPAADPNPRVGAVVVADDGRLAGEGSHAGAGSAHTEVVALDAAGEAARGGTAYVSLEPCDHTGRTDPCTRALTEAGVRRVVYAQDDPNPQAAGGAATLKAAGLETTGGVLADRAEQLNWAWSLALRRGRPMVTWKFAATLDGRSAAADGTSRWITSEPAPPGVETDLGDGDEWPALHATLMASDILVIATPTWLGQPSSVTKLVLERMDAMIFETKDDGTYAAYNKVAGVVVTGNEDGCRFSRKLSLSGFLVTGRLTGLVSLVIYLGVRASNVRVGTGVRKVVVCLWIVPAVGIHVLFAANALS